MIDTETCRTQWLLVRYKYNYRGKVGHAVCDVTSSDDDQFTFSLT